MQERIDRAGEQRQAHDRAHRQPVDDEDAAQAEQHRLDALWLDRLKEDPTYAR